MKMLTKSNKNKQKLSLHFKRVYNVVKIEKQPTFLHEIIKCCVCKILKDNKHCYITEGKFTSLLRCDIYDLYEDIVYEIVNTESDESIEFKRKEYPVREIVVINCNDYKHKTLGQIQGLLLNKINKYL